jgi:hypothetical protein
MFMHFFARILSSTYEKYKTMDKDNFVFLEVVEGFAETEKALVHIILNRVALLTANITVLTSILFEASRSMNSPYYK